MIHHRSVDLSTAARDYLAQRASAEQAKAAARQERRAMASLLAANGSIWVRQIGDAQLTRTFGEHQGKRRELVLVLEDFFHWCRHMGYLARGADPLAEHRDGADPATDGYFATVYGRCMRCGWIGLVKPSVWEVPREQRRVSTRLCRLCEESYSLSELGA